MQAPRATRRAWLILGIGTAAYAAAVFQRASLGVAEVEAQLGIPVFSIASLSDILEVLAQTSDPALRQHAKAVADYRERYGVKELVA